MSQRTARATRANGNGSAAEKLPDLEGLLGFADKATIDANRIMSLSQLLHNVNRIQVEHGLKDSDVIPADDVEGRTFAQQRAHIKKSYARLVEQIKKDDYWALVEQKLAEAKDR